MILENVPILLHNINNNNINIPEMFSPFGGTSDMEHIHTTYHTPKANSVQKAHTR